MLFITINKYSNNKIKKIKEKLIDSINVLVPHNWIYCKLKENCDKYPTKNKWKRCTLLISSTYNTSINAKQHFPRVTELVDKKGEECTGRQSCTGAIKNSEINDSVRKDKISELWPNIELTTSNYCK